MEHQARTLVDRPVSTVYNQWTQFETFPKFMEGVNRVQQLDDSTTRWDVEIAGVERSFIADIVDQRPDELIRWVTRDEPQHEGEVLFASHGPETEVALRLRFEPEGLVEQVADKAGFVKHRVEGDLDRFKSFIEERPLPTGAWRGSVVDGSSSTSHIDGSPSSTSSYEEERP